MPKFSKYGRKKEATAPARKFGKKPAPSNNGNTSRNGGGEFVRLTGLFETKNNNLIGSVKDEITFGDGGVIPAGTTFLVKESQPYKGNQPPYPFVLLIPPPQSE